tara:strand:- start:749 stop:1354 length:606 start_codon:yes stop_codon:yes gene_type:complete
VKYIKEQLFPTEVYIADDVLEEEYVDSMKEDILLSQQNKDKDNWQSDPKLHTKKKYKALTDKIIEVSKLVFKDKEYIYDTFQITDMWSNVLKPGEAHRPHTHSNNILSGVYYVESDKAAGIQFYDPRPQAGVINPELKRFTKSNATAWELHSVTNRMILFPSWLQHLVPINRSKNKRISIAFNLMLKGIVGQSTDYQSAEF